MKALCDWLDHESLSLLLVQPFSPMTTDTAAAALAAAIVLVESEDMAASTMGVNALPPRAPPHVVLRRSLGGSARDSDSADAIEAAGRNTNSAARALRDVKGFNAKAFIEASDAAAADAIARAEVAKEYVGALIAACVCSMRNDCNCVCNIIHIHPPPPPLFAAAASKESRLSTSAFFQRASRCVQSRISRSAPRERGF